MAVVAGASWPGRYWKKSSDSTLWKQSRLKGASRVAQPEEQAPPSSASRRQAPTKGAA